MKTLKRSITLSLLLTSMISYSMLAQEVLNLQAALEESRIREKEERARDVIQDNEYVTTGNENGVFLQNPLMLNGKPLDYGDFTLTTTGELTVLKRETAAGQTIQVPFFIYLRRNGKIVPMLRKEGSNPYHTRIDISEILIYAEPGDYLIIEAVRKEDGPIKRILKLIGGGC